MFGTGVAERTLNALIAENTDLRRALREERAAWSEERQKLLDRIMALTSPQAATILNPPPPRPTVSVAPTQAPRRLHFPGSPSVPLPPYPERASEKVG